MYKKSNYLLAVVIFFICSFSFCQQKHQDEKLTINDKGYYELPGLDVMVFDDFYPEGHQGGLTIVQFGNRVAANGDVRLESTPGQWSPTPKMGDKKVDRKNGVISVDLWYPDSSKNNKGFNPIEYPDLKFKYTIRTEAIGSSIKVTVDLDKPLPAEWVNKVGFNLELFPGEYFGVHYLMDGKPGMFPRQANGPLVTDKDGNVQISPLAVGKELMVAPGNNRKEIKFVSNKNSIQLLDGRALYENGWFVLRSTVAPNTIKGAVEWIISPVIDTDWKYKPVVQISQVGYHPKQDKLAVIELDKSTNKFEPIQLIKIGESSESIVKEDESPKLWGDFLRYKYLRFDFSDVTEEGLYKIKYGNSESNEFEISKDIYSRYVWQPTLEYFLPAQMCHMRVEGRYRLWHALCHMDDAQMAQVNKNYFDGYYQGPETLTKYKSGEHVPGLNIGGWHDAADFDVQIGSQSTTVYRLLLAYEFFKDDYDQTLINEKNRFTEIHQPDGKSDILQQAEHGLLSIVGGYEALGRFYRGMQEATRHRYVMNDFPDNYIYKKGGKDPVLNLPLPDDDRRVFTHVSPGSDLAAAQVLAAAYRVMKKFDPGMSDKCLKIAEKVYNENSSVDAKYKINTAAELYLSTSKKEYEEYLLKNVDVIVKDIQDYGIVIGRVVKKINNKEFTDKIEKAVKASYEQIAEQQEATPYGVPYKPNIWGAGWTIQASAVQQLFLHIGFPKIYPSKYVFNALNFILGCHPGENTSSFASGVGVNSVTVAYGFNRLDWTYIPGGVVSGTALIRPDLPELKVWPFFWQQGEYVMRGGATNYMLLAMAADHLFNK